MSPLMVVIAALVYGALLGVALALVVGQFCNPWIGRHRRR